MPLRDDVLTPIAGENPSGANLRWDSVYDKIKEARRADSEGPLGNDVPRERKSADYKLVIKLASDALASRTKDLQIAVWLTEALLNQEGFGGLWQGIDLLRSLISDFWDTVYPEIEDGDLELRAAPVEWLGTRLDDALRKRPITRSGLNYYKFAEAQGVGTEEDASQSEAKRTAREEALAEGKIPQEEFDKESNATPTDQYQTWFNSLNGATESLQALDELCREKFVEAPPNFAPLRRAVDDVKSAVNQILQKKLAAEGRLPPPPEPVEEAPVEEYAPVSNDQPSGAAAPVRKRVVAGIEPQDLDDAAERLAAVARYLRQQDSYSPGPYLLLRGYRWGELRGYGEYPDPTLLLPPTSEVRQNIRKLALESNWSQLLEAAEAVMAQPCGRVWLDLQRYVVRAADESGYGAIAHAIRSELRALLTDLPQLPNWTMMDDTPTANAETQAWLKEVAPPPVVAAPEPVEVQAAPPVIAAMEMDDAQESSQPEGEPIPPDTFTLALEAARSGRASEAIRMLADEIPSQPSGRARFQRKLQLAQICMMTGNELLAQPVLEDLVKAIDQHQLEDWEASGTVAHPLVLLYRCANKLDGTDPAFKQKLYARISRLDPVQALECAH